MSNKIKSSEYNITHWLDKGRQDQELDLNRIDIHYHDKNIAFLTYHSGTDGNYIWIKAMYVDPSFRGRGLAHLLIQEVIKSNIDKEIRLRAKPFRDKSVSTQDLEKFYAQYGFTPYDQEHRMKRPQSMISDEQKYDGPLTSPNPPQNFNQLGIYDNYLPSNEDAQENIYRNLYYGIYSSASPKIKQKIRLLIYSTISKNQ